MRPEADAPQSSTSTRAFPGQATRLLPEALRRLGPRELLVNEFFVSLQGESTWAGLPCFFIRLTGCHLRCVYCDSEYAFHEGEVFTIDSCLERVHEAGVDLVEVTGGEPLLQPACRTLLEELCDRGLTVLLETSGTVPVEKVDPRVHRIIDVKTPSSGMAAYNLRDLAPRLRERDEVKFVLESPDDYHWARRYLEEHPGILESGVPVHFSPSQGRWDLEDLAGRILADRLPVRLNLQLHKLIWPDRERGI